MHNPHHFAPLYTLVRWSESHGTLEIELYSITSSCSLMLFSSSLLASTFQVFIRGCNSFCLLPANQSPFWAAVEFQTALVSLIHLYKNSKDALLQVQYDYSNTHKCIY